MKEYIKSKWQLLLCILLIWFLYHFYFLYLSSGNVLPQDVYYLDALLCIPLLLLIGYDILQMKKKQKELKQCMDSGEYITTQDQRQDMGIYSALFEYNEQIYEKEKAEDYQKLMELQDYISRWSHEIKLPMAALNMMNERNNDVILRGQMKEQCEKMEQLLHTMLTGCKTWNTIYDKKMELLSLKEVISKSIRHQSFFLIKEHFEIENLVEDTKVLSDEQWLVYLLDQIIHNAIKYHKEQPKLTFFVQEQGTRCILHIKDNGIGISKKDLPGIFDKGTTGDNVRNGEYKSTGMGLYFVKKIISLLGHRIEVDSKEDGYTDMRITFDHHLDYFNLTDL